MAPEKKPQPSQSIKDAANKGTAAGLSSEALHNLTGFFDVLIQMDLEQKRKERSNSDEG
jgi:hypothetical protein